MALVIALIERTDRAQKISQCLQADGHSAIMVNNFQMAKVRLVESPPCDLIISDVHLSNGGSVFDFLKWVKSKPALLHIPFILLSIEPTKTAKYLSDGVRLAARVFGAAKYISLEVFDPFFLLSELEEYLPGNSATSVSPHSPEEGE